MDQISQGNVAIQHIQWPVSREVQLGRHGHLWWQHF